MVGKMIRVVSKLEPRFEVRYNKQAHLNHTKY
jgi:hypothetical protein